MTPADHAGGSGALLMVASAFTWAAGTVATKHALDLTAAAPSVVLVVQLIASVAALAVACAVAGAWPRRTWRRGWVGLLEPGVTYQLSLAGLSLTSAASASVLGSLEPALVPIVAWLLFRTRPGARVVAVVVGATVGSALVSFSASADGRSLAGDALIVAGVVTAACYVVLADRHVAGVNPLPAALTQQVWALGLVVPCSAVTVALTSQPIWANTSVWPFAVTALSGVLNYALPFWLYLTALTRLPVSQAATYLALIPVFGVALAVILLGEPVTVMQCIGAVIVVASLQGGPRRSRSRRSSVDTLTVCPTPRQSSTR